MRLQELILSFDQISIKLDCYKDVALILQADSEDQHVITWLKEYDLERLAVNDFLEDLLIHMLGRLKEVEEC